MSSGRQQLMVALLLDLLPSDGTRVANGRLFERLHDTARAAGLHCGEQDFATAREALVAAGLAVKGPGRGGSTARVVGAIGGRATGVADGAPPARTDGPAVEEQRPEFSLQAQSAPAERPFAAPSPTRMAAPKPGAPRRSDPAPGAPQVLSYRHPDRRINNPEVGLVNEASDPAQPKTTWAYDPHLDPVLQWAGKAERGSFEVDTVSLHVHERVDPMSILAAVARSRGDKTGKARPHGIQPGLFEAPFESLPLRDAVDFYRHDKGWSNRLGAGDSLLVMNSLLVKEGLAGQVQMIYIDPPYGIRYGSNFQPFVNKRDVKDRADAYLTQEPEMIKAFRDTWELGIHSYLTYLRDRMLLARELLSETGSVFVQISDENLHHVRELMDEVFGPLNACSLITFQKTTGQSSPNARTNVLTAVADYLVWHAKDASQVKYRDLNLRKGFGSEDSGNYRHVDDRGFKRPTTPDEFAARAPLASGLRVLHFDDMTFAQSYEGASEPHGYEGGTYSPPRVRGWSLTYGGMQRLEKKAGRLFAIGNSLRFVRFHDDFSVTRRNNIWADTGVSGAEMDRSIAAHADSETLYDQPERARNKLRITGPFSVEAVPFPAAPSLDTTEAPDASPGAGFTADAAVARSGATSRHAQWRDELLKALKDGCLQVEANGLDYFDTVRGELVSGGKSRIAIWSLDTDDDGRSLFPHQVFFPMAGKGERWEKLKKDIRAELNEGRLEAHRGTVSLPFEAGPQRRVAVKIVDDRGIESLKVMALVPPGAAAS